MNLLIGVLILLGVVHPGLMTATALGVTLVDPSFGLSFIIAYWIGTFMNAQLLLPLVYALPKSVYLFMKGKIRFMAIPASFITPLIWQIILIILYFISERFFPSLNNFLGYSHGFNLGWLLSALHLLYATYFTKSGRQAAQVDYEQVFEKRYRKI